MTCGCLLYVEIPETKAGRNAPKKTRIMWFLSAVYQNFFIETRDYAHFLFCVIGVKSFQPLNCCYVLICCCCCYCSSSSSSWFCLVFHIFSFVCFCKLHQPPVYPSRLLLKANHTIQTHYILNCAIVWNSAVTNHWPSH